MGVDGCSCAPALIDALDTTRHDSLFAATELLAAAAADGGCVLRLTNRGGGARNESKFRLAGIFLTEPWAVKGSDDRRCMLSDALPEAVRNNVYNPADVRFYGDLGTG